MKRVFTITEAIVNSPYTKMFLGILFLYSSITALISEYSSDLKGFSIHHGIAIYGLIMFLQSLISVLQAVDGLKKVKEDLGSKKN
jgi:hypothetical protein